MTRIKGAKPDAVVSTLVGADNVNFNRTFAGFGLDKTIMRLSLLLEENTLMGVGAENSANLYSCMGYFANSPSRRREEIQGRVHWPSTATRRRSSRRSAPTATPALNLAKAMFDKAGCGRREEARPRPPKDCRSTTASGRVTMRGRQVDKDMYLAECKGTRIRGRQDHQGGARAGPRARPEALPGRRPRAGHGRPAVATRWSRSRRPGAERAVRRSRRWRCSRSAWRSCSACSAC